MTTTSCTCGELRRATGGTHLNGCPVLVEWERLEAEWRAVENALAVVEAHRKPDLTDIATHASGVWLTAVVAVAAAFFVAAYLWSRS